MTRAPAMRSRPGWTRLSKPGDKCSARWRHESGWIVRHCGHPTANWPYYAEGPRGGILADVTGRGFGSLLEACEGVERELARVRRVVTRWTAPDGMECIVEVGR